MLKRERLMKICNIVNERGIVTVNDIIQELHVSDMTVRRDLQELDSAAKLLRIHGGAQSLTFSLDHELSHVEKATVQANEKQQIARFVATAIQDGETIFLGPGTTIEALASELRGRNIRIITNSYPVFGKLIDHQPTEIILTGGNYRSNTGAFVGAVTNTVLKKFKFTRSFIGCNGIHNGEITTHSLEEGAAQEIAFNNSKYNYLLADHKKFNREDFYVFYDLHNLDAVVTDAKINKLVIQHYKQYTKIVVADES